MKSRILTRHLPALLALLLAGPVLAADAPAAALPTPAPGILLDRVVAVVNDGVITQSEFDERLQQAIADFRRNNNAAPPPDSVLRPAVLERLIMDKVQYQRAQRIGIKISDEDLNAQLRQLAEENGMTLDQLPAALAQQGINYASFRDNYREEIARRQVRRSEVYNRVNITPRELDQFMERLKKLPDTEAEYNFSHILIAVPFEATQDDFAAAKARAEEVYEKAATEDFAQLAVEYSQGQTALEGGQMGWRAGADLPTLLAETIASLKPGEVSRPIQAANGYHIVRLNDLRTGVGDPVQQQTHARHILLTPNALQDDATVRQRLIEIRNRVLAGEDFAAFAKSLSEDAASAVEGGDLDWLSEGQTVPEFEEVMNQLAENEISEPFNSRFGWHIVQVLGRRQVDATEENLRQRAFLQLRQNKADQDLELWAQRLRDESYIEILIDN
jgi:peptidyl-prolyl cis-trans isomerase SurA